MLSKRISEKYIKDNYYYVFFFNRIFPSDDVENVTYRFKRNLSQI